MVVAAVIGYGHEMVAESESALLGTHHYHQLHLVDIVHGCRRACFQNLYFRLRAGHIMVVIQEAKQKILTVSIHVADIFSSIFNSSATLAHDSYR